MLSLFKKKKTIQVYSSTIQVDMHSHLLPGIDDGAKDFEHSIQLIQSFVAMGYKKLITTPHIMSDFYTNTPEIILDKLDKLNDIIKNLHIAIEIEAAAEYYLDEGFITKLERKEPLLAFGKHKYLLFETSYMNASPHFDYAVFLMQSQGYKPVLAHPERYVYLFDSLEKPKQWYDKGVLMQLNINSLSGYYSTSAKLLAEKLIDNKMVNFLGSDCHGERHIQAMKNTVSLPYYQKALKLDLLNGTLI
ncbi:tyrosine-protein phosphatase [Thermoflexibacter ruber]|uniref:protein-tyrosine-phosphatase n=1 Tax=Thermoflexibacter ruber TaxID=1003 RepID=A0A1I2H0C8_9BACT|nr:CpsB/CapC family capsule biosynthesis tyrosine phosphatase [Thermoflexibacter ruber]SFF23525.1 Tyrosine-protein phosphatase YwqE [Thermoflexibacter ruber]